MHAGRKAGGNAYRLAGRATGNAAGPQGGREAMRQESSQTERFCGGRKEVLLKGPVLDVVPLY